MPDPQPAREELASRIAELAAEGMTLIEIGTQLGLTPKRVWRLARRSGVPFRRGGARRIGTALSRSRYDVVQALAAQAQVPPSTMAARIVAIVVDEGLQSAVRRLGTLARPKRSYIRRRQEA